MIEQDIVYIGNWEHVCISWEQDHSPQLSLNRKLTTKANVQKVLKQYEGSARVAAIRIQTITHLEDDTDVSDTEDDNFMNFQVIITEVNNEETQLLSINIIRVPVEVMSYQSEV